MSATVDREISGNDIVLKVDPLGGTNYVLIVCLNQNSLASTTAVIDAGSKCGPSKLAGVIDNKIDFEIIDVLNVSSGKISSSELFTLQQAKTVIGWYYGPLTPVAEDVSYYGNGFIGEWKNAATKNTPVTTTATIEVTGSITQVTTGS